MSENANQKGAPQKIEIPSEAYGSGSASGFLPEKEKNPKEQGEGAYQQNGQQWLGGPQNGNETPSQSDSGSGETWTGRGKPSEAARRVGTGNISVDTQTGSQAKGMGSEGYTKHRFDETPGDKTEGAYQTASHSTGWENSETEVKPLETSKKPSKLGGSSDN